MTLLIILLGISACGSRTEDPDGGAGDGADTQGRANGTSRAGTTGRYNVFRSGPAAESEVAGKALIVYFSWSGNTENVATEIRTRTGADIFEIVAAGGVHGGIMIRF